MLGKLLKYEFINAAKIMVLFYAALILLSAIFSVSVSFGADLNEETNSDLYVSYELTYGVFGITAGLSFIFLYFMIIAVAVATVIYSISRFKNTVLGPEGYLTHTLPVKTRDIILSKTINAVVWQIFSGIAVFAALLLIFAVLGINLGEVLWEILRHALEAPKAIIIFVEFLVFIPVAAVGSFLQIFASMAIGFSSNRHRVIKSVGVYILFCWAMSFVTTFLLTFDQLFAEFTPERGIGLLFIVILLYALLAVCFYFITHHFLSKKLNLQ